MKPLYRDAAVAHPLLRAYTLLFEEAPSHSSLFLDRDELAKAFIARALHVHPHRAECLGRAREDPDDRLEELENAFRLLAEVMGQSRVVFIACGDQELASAVDVPPPTGLLPSGSWDVRPVPDRIRRSTPDLATMVEQSKSAPSVKHRVSARAGLSSLRVGAPGRPRHLLGRFLLRHGHITLRQLVDAVLWQRSQRPRAGEIAVGWGIMSAQEVTFVLQQKRIDELFCGVAVRLGFMSTFQRLAILARQRRLQTPIGRYFVERGILTADVVEEAAATVKRLEQGEGRKLSGSSNG